jgi:hypothetical protein
MSPLRKAAFAAAVTVSTLAGGAIGGALVTGTANAQTTAPAAPTDVAPAPAPASPSAAPRGTFHPNEDAAHEATESAAREAQEDAGQFPTIP